MGHPVLGAAKSPGDIYEGLLPVMRREVCRGGGVVVGGTGWGGQVGRGRGCYSLYSCCCSFSKLRAAFTADSIKEFGFRTAQIQS